MGRFLHSDHASPPVNFSELYLRVREKEGRLYSDDVVARLPDISSDHPLAKEWRTRADSSTRLIRYLAKLSRPLNILELGCGNGWLSGKLSQISGAQVWGIDVLSCELTQASRLFTSPRLTFLAADIFRAPFSHRTFDVIVLASVIQYFPDLPALITTLQTFLKSHGEIHLLDSPFYQPAELPFARERSRAYYTALGFAEMAGHYFHHPVTALDPYSPRWYYRPENFRVRLTHRFGKAVSPFPWIVLGGSP